MNGQRPGLFELISRLPPRVWLQAALGLIGFAVLAVLGFAVIAGAVAIVLVVLLLYRLRAWILRLFGARPGAPVRPDQPKITDVPYEIVDRRNDKP